MPTSSPKVLGTPRQEGARLTRRRILDAAAHCFLTGGYAATSIATIAAEAGVSVQTLYNSVGRKPQLLKETYDVLRAGDDQQIAMADRPQIRALQEATDSRAALMRYASLVVEIHQRVAGLVAMIQAQAAAGDPDLAQFAATIDSQRLVGATNVVSHLHHRFGLRQGLSVDAAADVLWTLTSAQLERQLVIGRGWTYEHFEHWLTDAMASLLIGPRA